MTTSDNQSLRTALSDPAIRSMILVVLVVLTGLGVVLPVLALYARSFGVDYRATGVLLAAFGLARLVGDLVAGALIARHGERVAGVGGMGFLAACATATGLAPNYPFAVVAWGLGGLGSAIVFASLFSYMLRAAPEGRTGRTLSYFYGAFNIGIIAGGAIGGTMASRFGLESPLFLHAALLVVAMILYLALVPDLKPGRKRDPEGPGKMPIAQMLRIQGFPTALVLNFTYLWVIIVIFDTLIPLFAHDELGATSAHIGVLYSIAVAAEFFVLFPAGTLSDRLGRKKVLVPGLAALIATVILLGFSTSLVMLALLLILFAFASGFAGVPPAAILSDVMPEEESGRAVGVFRFCGDLGFFLGPLVAGAASSQFGFKGAFAITAIMPLLALVMTIRTPETMRFPSEEPAIRVAPV